MMKTPFYAILCFFIIVSSHLQALAYTLEEAVDRGLEANNNIKVQEFVVQEAEKSKLQAYGNFLPTLSLTLQETQLVNDDDSSTIDVDYLSQRRGFKSVRLSQPVFTGLYGMNSVKKAEYILEAQKVELENSKGKLVYDIRRQFIQYLKFQDDIIRFEASVERLKKQLGAAQAFYERQMAPKLHVMQAEVALAKAHQDLSKIRTSQRTTKMTLNQLLNLEIDQPGIYSGSLAGMDFERHKTLEFYLQEAKHRPDVKLARLNVDISKKELSLIMSQNAPKVSVDFSYNDTDREYDDVSSRDENSQYWSAMLNVSMQLFRGGQTINSALKQKIATKRYERSLQEQLSKVEMEVQRSYALMQDARKRINSAIGIKDAATRSYERAERRYTTGLGTSVDVLNAQNDISQAEAEIAQARADFQVNRAELDYLSGIQ